MSLVIDKKWIAGIASMFAVCASILFIVVAVLIKTYVVGYFQVPQNGMYPGLPAGSKLFVNLRAYPQPSSVKRGDIVVFLHEQDGKQYNYIWRVVALPGETVESVHDSLKINGKEVQRQQLRESDGKTIYREQIGEVAFEVAFDSMASHFPPDSSLTVPDDHYYLMGDNRFNAVDSRYLGPIPFKLIIGKKL